MPTPEERIAELGYTLPGAAKPLGVYVPALRTGNYVYTSGQLPLVEGELRHAGKVGAQVSAETAKDDAVYCALNAVAAVKAEIGELSLVRRVVKVVGYVASEPSFTGQPQVVNGASEFIGAVFGDEGVHVRSAVGVAVLPIDSPVELELIVEVD